MCLGSTHVDPPATKEQGASAPRAEIAVFYCDDVVLVDEGGRVDSSTYSRPSGGIPGVHRLTIEPEEESGPYEGPVGWVFGLGEPSMARFLLWLRAERDSSPVYVAFGRGRCKTALHHFATRSGWYRCLIILNPISDEDSCAVTAHWSGPTERPASWGNAEPLGR